MRHLYLSIALLLAVCFAASARQISENEAMLKAAAFGQKAVASRLMSNSRSSAMKLAYTQQSATSTANNCFYVFNRGTADGYIIVSADDRAAAILGYTDSGSFDYASLPDNARWWFSEYQRQIQYLIDHPNLKNRTMPKGVSTSVGPLCKSLWDQDAPFSNNCPTYTDSTRGLSHCATGCVATATAQVMYYHKWPAKGTGSMSYTSRAIYGSDSLIYNLSADFSKSTYDWANITDRYSSSSTTVQNAAVAKLMSDVGISVKMNYADQSDADMGPTAEALTNFFGYDQSLSILNRSYFTADNWDKSIRTELDAKRPVLTMGMGADDGHAFICDGYNSEGYFHFNWGWGGMSNGYYLTGALNPPALGIGGGNGGGFNFHQFIYVNLMKPTTGFSYRCGMAYDSISAVDTTVNVGQNVKLSLPSVTNTNYKPFTGKFAFITCDKNNNIIASQEFVENPEAPIVINDVLTLPNNIYYTVPSSLSDGVYSMHIGCEADGESVWNRLLNKIGSVADFTVTVSGSKATVVSSPYESKLSVTAFSASPAIYSGHSSDLSLTVANSGVDYHGPIAVIVMDTDNNALVEAGDMYDIPGGKTTPITLNVNFDIPAGPVNLIFINQDSTVIYSTSAVVADSPADPVLTLTSKASFPDANNVDPINLNLSASVSNSGGLFTGNIYSIIYNSEGNLVGEEAIKTAIDNNQSKTLFFPDGFGKGVQGASYTASICTIDDEGTFIPIPPAEFNNISFTVNATPTSIGSVGTSVNSIFPNPAADVVTIRNANAITGISVYSVTGALVLNKAMSGQSSVTLNVASLPAGSYLVRVATSTGITTQRFIKL
jgi:hypothetical protein